MKIQDFYKNSMKKRDARLILRFELYEIKNISGLQNYQNDKKEMPSNTTFSNLNSSNTG